MSTTQLTIDLSSVSYMKFFYENKKGDIRRTLPKVPTFNGEPVPNEYAAKPNGVPEPAISYLTRRGLIDIWSPVCIYQFRNNHSMRFTGEEAKKMRDKYNKHIYGK